MQQPRIVYLLDDGRLLSSLPVAPHVFIEFYLTVGSLALFSVLSLLFGLEAIFHSHLIIGTAFLLIRALYICVNILHSFILLLTVFLCIFFFYNVSFQRFISRELVSFVFLYDFVLST